MNTFIEGKPDEDCAQPRQIWHGGDWLRSLGARVFLILLVATVAIQVLSFGGIMVYTGINERHRMEDYLARDVAFIQRFLARLPTADRAEWLASLNRGYYALRLQPADARNIVVHDRSLDDVAMRVSAQVGPGSPVTTIVEGDTEARLPGMELPIDAAQKLLVLFPDRAPPYPAPPRAVVFLYLGFVTLGVVVVAAIAVRIATRPLRAGAQATRALAENIDAPPIPERGPSEVVEVARAFNQMQRSIRRHLDERTQILTAISHDMKTPLTRLRLRVGELDADPRRMRIEADIDALNTLVQEGLDYARSAQLREAIVPVDLNSLAESIAEQANDVGQDVRVEGRADGPVRCAPRALERALQNLVDNAVKYGERARIRLSCAGNRAEIRVEDDGPGLPEALLDKVFEPFFRAEESRNRETGGTGLGLTIARNLVRAQGGEIGLANRVPHGLVARVSLPQQGT